MHVLISFLVTIILNLGYFSAKGDYLFSSSFHHIYGAARNILEDRYTPKCLSLGLGLIRLPSSSISMSDNLVVLDISNLDLSPYHIRVGPFLNGLDGDQPDSLLKKETTQLYHMTCQMISSMSVALLNSFHFFSHLFPRYFFYSKPSP